MKKIECSLRLYAIDYPYNSMVGAIQDGDKVVVYEFDRFNETKIAEIHEKDCIPLCERIRDKIVLICIPKSVWKQVIS